MKLAIFDFDGTLYPKDTLPSLLNQWYKHKYSKLRLAEVFIPLLPIFIQYKAGIYSKYSKEEMRMMAVNGFTTLFKNMSEEEVSKYFYKTSQSIKKQLNSNVVLEVKKAKKNGYHTVLLSGAYNILLDNIGQYLEIDTVIGTEIYFNNGFYDSSRNLNIIYGALKAKKIQQYFKDIVIDWQNSYAYSDSYSDIALLELVGSPIVVNPDKKLHHTAIEKGWKIM